MSTPYSRIRLSDTERADAMSALGNALGEGRLTMGEFDERCRLIAQAEVQADLEPVFSDIPQSPRMPAEPEAPVQLYTPQELVAARRDGQKTRAGLFWLTTFGSVGGSIMLTNYFNTETPAVLLLLIPTVFVLLYVMKVGPDSWYTPSLRQMERKRRELVRIQRLEIEAGNAREEAMRKAARRQQMNQITDEALAAAHRTVKRFSGKETGK